MLADCLPGEALNLRQTHLWHSASSRLCTSPVAAASWRAVLVKDQIDTAWIPTTHGFIGFKKFLASRDATVVSRRKTPALHSREATMGECASGDISST
jgi:Asp-tRNA(Asn)/Glu-tRNA(Gln) amidotransferase A subunit family amidase